MGKVIVILGPTASGKTNLSIQLAKELNGEIISADSMQVYKFMDIGTAKPSLDEREGIKHYLIDEISLDQDFSVADYQKLAHKYIDEIISKNKLPIIVGGTGLYINSLIYNINFSESTIDFEFRERLKKEAEEHGSLYLHQKLETIDPEAAARLHPNDTKRIIRALEVFKETAKPISEHQKESRLSPPKHDYVLIGLKTDREELYAKINQRVDLMIEKGLVDEVKSLVSHGFGKGLTSMQAIGYKEIIDYLDGEMSLEEASELIKMSSRRYAKRQMTWFKRLHDVNWFNVNLKDSAQKTLYEDVKKFVQGSLKCVIISSLEK